ncbi:hypothetical protein J7T55_007917 [Diaporthe amygdali]|uniref:uncharacterized protein n=1 Tax=Phomopsis amygdali TaxID=1214568 RepID=UPI0022FE42E2|nr:uncharacterized protein J7T55_007917 [Diaporthe amygdali]KAJ0114083.1 hypothetical protein J7T55_007917 [Diaporthe amygdali]
MLFASILIGFLATGVLAGTPANCCVGNAEGQVNYNPGHTSSCCSGRGSISNGECDATDFDGFTSCCNSLGDKVCTF